MSKWIIDTAHASAEFKVQHLGLSWVRGQIFGVTGEIEYDPQNPAAAQFHGKLDVDTLNTGVEMRDGHLKSADFFDVANHPQIEFVSKDVNMSSDNQADVTGDLTIRGTTLPTNLKVAFLGVTEKFEQDGSSHNVAAFTITAKLNRQDFGLKWNVDLPGGKVLVGNEVEIVVEVEAIEQK